MAIVYSADLVPTKPQLIADWLQQQPWYDEPGGAVELLGAFRFDDPSGAVGVETHVVRGASGAVYQVPLTYRGAPLEGAEAFLVTEMTHSVLGERWVYDAVADPVAIDQLVASIAAGSTQADVFVDGSDTPAPVSVAVRGTGGETPTADARGASIETRGGETRVAIGGATLVVHRVVDGMRDAELRLDAESGFEGAPATLVTIEF